MKYLYGDCSPSPLEVDYLDYLRRVMGVAVEVLLAEDRLAAQARRRRALHARTAELEQRLESLRRTVREAVGGVARAPEDDPVTRCANHIESELDDVVARALDEVRAQDDAAASEIAARERVEHAACLDAVEGLLAKYDLPDASLEVELEPSRGAGHPLILRARTPYHVTSEVELDPGDSPLAAAEVRAAALARTRAGSLKLDKLVVVSARCDRREIAVRLRAARDPRAEGFDVTVDRASGTARVGERAPDDPGALALLATAIGEALEARAGHRGRLRSVTIDDVPLDEHDQPSALIDRVFGAMAPQVRAVVERSPVPGELSLRRDLGGDRREEIFCAHATLAEIVAQVPVARRRHFDTLPLPGIPSARPATEPIEAVEISEPSISIEE